MKTILVTDDSASMREMVAYNLKSAGYQVIEAVDGVDALNKANQQIFDCVVSDVNMPNMDGIDLVRQLRLLPAYHATPIILLTTESSPDKKKAGKEAGVTGWILKPFNPDQLLKTITKLL